MTLWRSLFTCCCLVATAQSQRILQQEMGVGSERFGETVAAAGDVDGDDVGDWIVGSPLFQTVRVFSGRTGVRLHEVFGGVGSRFGQAIDGGCDVDADGLDDFVVGAPNAVGGLGSVTVFSGANAAVLYTFPGVDAGGELGYSVAFVGDVDADGHPDIGVGVRRAIGQPGAVGQVLVYSGRDGSALRVVFGDAVDDRLGSAVTGAGDVDGDGHDDFAVGAIGNGSSSGYVRLYSGIDSAVLFTKLADAPSDGFGARLDGGHDVNGDGTPDLVAGTSTSGYARVFSGNDGAVLHDFASTPPNGGHSVAMPGDVNGDGCADVLVGEAGGGLDLGRVTLYSGQDGAVLFRLESQGDPGGFFGEAVSGAEDVDCDGFPDVIVGAPGDSHALVYSLASAARDVHMRHGGHPRRLFGTVVDGGIDVNNDGFDDVIIGAPFADVRAVVDGLITVLSGKDLTELHEFVGDGEHSALGGQGRCAAAGDVNNDGFGDIVGASGWAPVRQRPGGFARVWSGRDGSVLHTFDMSPNHASANAAGDVNNDGSDDVIVENGSFSRVYSGSDGSILYTIVDFGGQPAGDVNNDGFDDFMFTSGTGSSVYGGKFGVQLIFLNGPGARAAGDVNGDGYDDVILAKGTLDAAVLSGRDWSPLLIFTGLPAATVDGAGDVNGDGVPDLLLSDPPNQLVRVMSGDDGRLLQIVRGGATSTTSFGTAVAGVGDTDGDGLGDFAVGDSSDGTQILPDRGAAWLFASGVRSHGKVVRYSHPCPGADGHLPRIGSTRPLQLGRFFEITLRGGPAGQLASCGLGETNLDLDLGLIGMVDCRLLSSRNLGSLRTTTDGIGRGTVGFNLPNNPSFLGASVHLQWLILAPGANPMQVIASDGMVAYAGEPYP